MGLKEFEQRRELMGLRGLRVVTEAEQTEEEKLWAVAAAMADFVVVVR